MNRWDRLINRIGEVLLIFCGILTTLMALTIVYGIISRLMHQRDLYSFECTGILLLVSSSLAFGPIALRRRHITVSTVFSQIPARGQYVLTIAHDVLALCFSALLLWEIFGMASFVLRTGERSGSMAETPLFPLYFAIAVGIGLLCLALVANVVRHSTGGSKNGA